MNTDLSGREYAMYYDFFTKINTPLNLLIALLILVFTGYLLIKKLSSKLLALICIFLLYLLIGAFFAPGMWGGQADFLYDPRYIFQNLTKIWTLTLFWPLTILLRG